MCTFTTNCGSITGSIIYSDTFTQYTKAGGEELPSKNGTPAFIQDIPKLNTVASIPILGPIGGITRIALSIIHIIGHVFAAILTLDKGHLYHVVKGGTELLRGVIETLPIIGRIFCWSYDADGHLQQLSPAHPFHNSLGAAEAHWSFFIIKIKNPDNPDNLDTYRETKKFIQEQ